MNRSSQTGRAGDLAAAAAAAADPLPDSSRPAWVPCVQCGGAVSVRAAACAYCGAPADHAPGRAALDLAAARVQELTAGAYVVEGLVGCGPHGCTFRARSTTTGAMAALKLVRLAAGPADETAARLGECLAAAAAVGHPRILAATALQRPRSDAVWWTTPLVPDGYGVDRLLGDAQPTSLAAISRFLTDVADALGAAHGRGIAHLALTPSKLLVDRAGRGWVSDLGVALGLPSATWLSGPGAAERAAYAAPEQWHGAPADGRADQYALAVMTYELLTGQRRAEAGSVGTLALLPSLDVSTDAPLRPDVPLHVNAALRRALSKRPEHRFGTIAEFADAAVGNLDTTPASLPTVHPVLDLPPRRRGWFTPTVAAVVLLAAGAAVFGPWHVGEGPLAREARATASRAAARRAAQVAAEGRQGGGGEGGGGGGGRTEGAASADVAATAAGDEAASEPSYIRITAGGRAALVLVDGTPRGLAPVTVRVPPGSHTVTLRGGGYGGTSRSVSSVAGGTASADFPPPAP